MRIRESCCAGSTSILRSVTVTNHLSLLGPASPWPGCRGRRRAGSAMRYCGSATCFATAPLLRRPPDAVRPDIGARPVAHQLNLPRLAATYSKLSARPKSETSRRNRRINTAPAAAKRQCTWSFRCSALRWLQNANLEELPQFRCTTPGRVSQWRAGFRTMGTSEPRSRAVFRSTTSPGCVGRTRRARDVSGSCPR
jgi:hypothetical protein